MAAADGGGPARGVDRRQLRRLLAERAGLELSSASVSALFTKQPAQVKLSTLAALCTALECTPATCSTSTPRPLSGRQCPRPPGAGRAQGSQGPVDAADLRGPA